MVINLMRSKYIKLRIHLPFFRKQLVQFSNYFTTDQLLEFLSKSDSFDCRVIVYTAMAHACDWLAIDTFSGYLERKFGCQWATEQRTKVENIFRTVGKQYWKEVA